MEPSVLDKVANTLEESFRDNWWQPYKFMEEILPEGIDILHNDFIKFINDRRGDCFDYLNESILLGEFAKCDKLSERISSIEFFLDNITPLLPPVEEIQNFLENELKTNFIDALRIALNYYSSLILEFEKIYSLDNRFFVLRYNPKAASIIEDSKFNDIVIKSLNFFLINIELAQLDLRLTPNEKFFNNLVKLADSILEKKVGANKYAIVLREKCNFLICKWVIRKQQLDSNAVFFQRDNSNLRVTVDVFKNKLIPHWREYIESHYEIVNHWKSDINSDFDQIKAINFEKLKVLDLHRIVKYYKDVNKSIDNLSKVVFEFQRRFDLAKSKNDTKNFYVYGIDLIYAMNNEFSLFLEDKTLTIEKIENLYDKIQAIQASTGINNYFVQNRYLGYLVGELEHLYNERKALVSIQNARNILTKCEKIINEYSQNVKWSVAHYNYIFQLPYNECLTPTSNQSLPYIFIASSFLLPMSKEKTNKEFDEYKQKVYQLKSSIEIYENMQSETKEISGLKNKMETITNEIHAREIKSMEILGIFTAVVTFVLGSLPTFKYIHTPYQAALFMLALSTSLGVFVFLILSMTRGGEILKKRIWLIIALFATAIIFWLSLIKFTKDPSVIVINEEQLNKEQQAALSDSLAQKKAEKIVDSILKAEKNKHTSLKESN